PTIYREAEKGDGEMSENTDVTLREVRESLRPTVVESPRTAVEIREQVNRVQEVMKAVMHNGVHYGTIPGCGDRPALLKPGAEKLMMTFRLAVKPIVVDMSDPGTCRYRVNALVTSATSGVFLGEGIGECSSAEEKYAWRRASVDQEWMEADPGSRREKWMRGKQGSAYKVKQVRSNPADVANTVLKMAKKRALIDAVLTVTAASDIFSQDIEEGEDAEVSSTAPTHEVASEVASLRDKLKAQVHSPQIPPAPIAAEDIADMPDKQVPDLAPRNKSAMLHSLKAKMGVSTLKDATAMFNAAAKFGLYTVDEMSELQQALQARMAQLQGGR
ncbi:MAG: hypothetical protein ACRCZI_07845, partial [Cetobacterium sp.]